MICSRCHCVSYCNSTCQKKHWKEHKIKCKIQISLSTFLKPFPIHSHEHRRSLMGNACKRMYPNNPMTDIKLLFYDKICSICLKSPYHTGNNTKEWYSCDKCHFGWCCSQAHWEEYVPRHTPAICAL